MNEPIKIALIPAYNPDQKMLNVLDKLKENNYHVVIVNDGSDAEFTQTFEKADKADKILNHHRNRGKGVALKTGLVYIRDSFTPPYTVVTVDADGQHRIDDTNRVTATCQKHPDSLIVGSRKLKSGAPFRSISGNFITRTMLHTLTPAKEVYDTQSGLRAFSDRLIDDMIQISGERYEYEMNVLIQITKRNIPIRETPIKAIYIDNNNSSHFRTFYDAKRIYKVIFKSRFSKN